MKLKNYKNNISVNFTVVFAVVVIVLAGLSFYKFVDFLINERVDYNEWSADLGRKTETKFSTSFFQKFNFINLNGLVRNIMGIREMNGVIKLNNGHLLTAIEYTEYEKLEEYAEKILQAKNYLAENGIEFIYAVTPYTSCKFDPQLPAGIEDFGNDGIDRLCEFLRKKGIEPVDFRQEFYNDGVEHYKMMYRTDHHWTTEAGFYAFCKLNEIIEQKLGVQVDEQIKDFSNYNVTKYARWHLGSRGQRTGAYFSDIDDFNLITPKFETEIEKFNTYEDFYKNDKETKGTFESIVYDLQPLKNKQMTSRYTYDFVLGNKISGFFCNKKSNNKTRIFFVADSQGKAVAPFFILAHKYFCFGGFDCKQIETYKPDIVVMLQYGDHASRCITNFYFNLP